MKNGIDSIVDDRLRAETMVNIGMISTAKLGIILIAVVTLALSVIGVFAETPADADAAYKRGYQAGALDELRECAERGK